VQAELMFKRRQEISEETSEKQERLRAFCKNIPTLD
jgi:hypothetical protein